MLHDDTKTIFGTGLADYTSEPIQNGKSLVWQKGSETSLNPAILRKPSEPFQPSGGLRNLAGNLGRAVMKISAVDPLHHTIQAPARVFHDQGEVKAAFRAGEFIQDVVIVLRFQGPRANGMPELHSLTPLLTILQGRGLKVALVTDGRMSGASGKIPAAIHVSPEALDGGPIARLADGDVVLVDATNDTLKVLDDMALDRPAAQPDLSQNHMGLGRELFANFRRCVSSPETGASIFQPPGGTS